MVVGDNDLKLAVFKSCGSHVCSTDADVYVRDSRVPLFVEDNTGQAGLALGGVEEDSDRHQSQYESNHALICLKVTPPCVNFPHHRLVPFSVGVDVMVIHPERSSRYLLQVFPPLFSEGNGIRFVVYMCWYEVHKVVCHRCRAQWHLLPVRK